MANLLQDLEDMRKEISAELSALGVQPGQQPTQEQLQVVADRIWLYHCLLEKVNYGLTTMNKK